MFVTLVLLCAMLAMPGADAHAGFDPALLCKERKAKAVGKYGVELLRAHGRNVKRANPARLCADASRARSKLTRAFTKAEFGSDGQPRGCDILGDVAAIEAMAAAFVADAVETIAPPRPNVILILTDDQRHDTFPAMAAVHQRLVAEGVRFANGMVPTSQCCSSRASILTGKYLNDIDLGPYDPFEPAFGFHASGEDQDTLAVWLDDAGYRTAFMGKYMNDFNGLFGAAVPPGWDEWFAFTKLGYNPGSVEYSDNGTVVAGTDYSTDELAARAVAFLESAEEPFFLEWAPFAPHNPHTPAARHQGLFDAAPDYTSPNYLLSPFASGKPPYVAAFGPGDHALAQFVYRRQLEMLQAVDEAVEAMFDVLETRGIGERTMVVYTSDNGYLWGEHQWIQKLVPYEESLRVPLAIRYPALVQQPGRTVDALALNLDIPATIADAAGVALPGGPARSLVPWLKNETPAWRSDFLIEYPFGALPLYFGVRTEQWKYVRTNDPFVGFFQELYDLTLDPYETVNIAAQNPGVVATLDARVDELVAE
jgi:arylsulfatase A-like enzyme